MQAIHNVQCIGGWFLLFYKNKFEELKNSVGSGVNVKMGTKETNNCIIDSPYGTATNNMQIQKKI